MTVNTVNLDDEASPPSRRERQRDATMAEIRDTARRQLAVTGAAGLSLRAVAREMGLTAPALYRYYDDRDALLEALIVDAYTGLNDQLELARDAQPGGDGVARMAAACLAYRQWGVDRPHEFALVFGGPVPGFDAPPEGPTKDAGMRFGLIFLELFTMVVDPATGPPASAREPALDRALEAASAEMGLEMGSAGMQQFLSAWGRLHGLICLEVFSHIGWVGMPDPGALFRADVIRLFEGLGQPYDLERLRAVERRTAARRP